jgi:hypothetical protein
LQLFSYQTNSKRAKESRIGSIVDLFTLELPQTCSCLEPQSIVARREHRERSPVPGIPQPDIEDHRNLMAGTLISQNIDPYIQDSLSLTPGES